MSRGRLIPVSETAQKLVDGGLYWWKHTTHGSFNIWVSPCTEPPSNEWTRLEQDEVLQIHNSPEMNPGYRNPYHVGPILKALEELKNKSD